MCERKRAHSRDSPCLDCSSASSVGCFFLTKKTRKSKRRFLCKQIFCFQIFTIISSRTIFCKTISFSAYLKESKIIFAQKIKTMSHNFLSKFFLLNFVKFHNNILNSFANNIYNIIKLLLFILQLDN